MQKNVVAWNQTERHVVNYICMGKPTECLSLSIRHDTQLQKVRKSKSTGTSKSYKRSRLFWSILCEVGNKKREVDI